MKAKNPDLVESNPSNPAQATLPQTNKICRLAEWVTFFSAQGGNGNSRNVSCSKPGLHCRKRPWEGALYRWLTKSASDSMHIALNELHNYIYMSQSFKPPFSQK